MESGSSELPDPSHAKIQNVTTANAESVVDNSASDNSSKVSTSGISSWAKNLKIPQPLAGSQNDTQSGTPTKSTFARFTSGFGLRLSPKSSPTEENSAGTSPTTETAQAQSGFIGTLTKGIVDSSKSAVKAMQVKARHVVSQNKRRYQIMSPSYMRGAKTAPLFIDFPLGGLIFQSKLEGGFDLDMTYITENIIAMGFPAGDMSSGFFGYVEGFYRNHMEEVIKFFEMHHKDKYKVYNLCSERLYDASLFEGKVASFPFDDHNCPPIQLIISFCQSAYSWLKEDIENVVVVHCKAGMARTGLMIASLLLYLKFFPTAEESIDYYNQKRCFDGKALVLPSQIRYVKYFERVLTYFNGENPTSRRCMLRGFRLHRCPYWVRPSITVSNHTGVLFSTKKHPRTNDLSPEDFWFTAPKKGIMVFALPGEPGLTELAGDFKIHFHDRQGDFYCWLNTTMIENRKVLNTSDLDGFDKRKLPSPGFQVEVVLVDYDAATVPARAQSETAANQSVESSGSVVASGPSPGTENEAAVVSDTNKETGNKEKDDVFSDSEAEESVSSKSKRVSSTPKTGESVDTNVVGPGQSGNSDQAANLAHKTEHMSLGSTGSSVNEPRKDVDKGTISGLEGSNSAGGVSEFKVLAADASVFTFGDEEDYESE